MFPERLKERLGGLVELSAEQVLALAKHYDLLVRWNLKLNLTRITELNEAVDRHYCESLFLGAHLPTGALRIVDIGSGAGFPGFPVAVLRPDCSVTLVEAHQRKSVFLREASRGVPNVRVVAKRMEDVGEEFDWAISRAVSYADLGGRLKEIAANADLLTGAEEPPDGMGFEWKTGILLPWGRQRYLRRGRRLSAVTRFT